MFLNWDHREAIYANGPCGGPQGASNQERYGLSHAVMMLSLDRGFSALLEDMHQRGLLDETLVCFITEMGRTRLYVDSSRSVLPGCLSKGCSGFTAPADATISSPAF